MIESVQVPARSAQAILALCLNYARSRKKPSGITRHSREKLPEDYVVLNGHVTLYNDIAARSCGMSYVSSAPMAEAHALWDGLLLAGDMGCNRIVVQSDCLEVVETMRSDGNSVGQTAAVYEECTVLCRGFARVKFDHCPTEANKATHILANHAVGSLVSLSQHDPPDGRNYFD